MPFVFDLHPLPAERRYVFRVRRGTAYLAALRIDTRTGPTYVTSWTLNKRRALRVEKRELAHLYARAAQGRVVRAPLREEVDRG